MSLSMGRMSAKSAQSSAMGRSLAWSASSGVRSAHVSLKGRRVLKTTPRVRLAVKAAGADLLNSEAERARKDRRTVFTHEDWAKHRAPTRYARHLRNLFESSVMKSLRPAVTFFAADAVLVNILNDYTTLPFTISLPFNALGYTTGAISLLLVFRTNSAYGRWWEARKIWGGLLNRSRDFVRQGLTWFAPEDEQLKQQLVRYTTAFAFSLKVHLRSDEDMRTELQDILTADELEMALKEVHVPCHILHVIAEVVRRAEISEMRTTAMDENITFFHDVLGKCERIFKTPIPQSYTRLTSRFLILGLTVLPVALYEQCGWKTVPVEIFTALFLLGIEDVGVNIEEPFSILSCEAICGSVQSNCAAMLANTMAVRSGNLVKSRQSAGGIGAPANQSDFFISSDSSFDTSVGGGVGGIGPINPDVDEFF